MMAGLVGGVFMYMIGLSIENGHQERIKRRWKIVRCMLRVPFHGGGYILG